DRTRKIEKDYIGVHLENDYLDVWVMPEIGGRIFTAQDKTTGYDFFYRQHVIKPALIGTFGSWLSGGLEFNWPFHHRASTYMPCDFVTEECEDGSVICWLSEHEPIDRMKGMVGIVLRPDSTYLETRVKVANRTPVRHSFLWWENAAVPVNEDYQIFFPHDVTYVNFHYENSRISYPIAGDNFFNGHDMREPRDISMHKNTRDATSYFACASKFDFFGGYDHGKECGVVHIADHHVSPGKKMWSWAYGQLSKTWENSLTDEDGQYAELMAGCYTDNQPDFTWLEPYETKEFSQFWYPISRIGTPDFANLDCAAKLGADKLALQPTGSFGTGRVTAVCDGKVVLDETVTLQAAQPVFLDWCRPQGLVTLTVVGEDGEEILCYREEHFDQLKMPPVRQPMPQANETQSAEELYLAGVHVDQYKDPTVMPDAYWNEALKRNPNHAPSHLALARYHYGMHNLTTAKKHIEKAIAILTRFNARLENGDAYYLYGLILEAMEDYEAAYNYFYKAAWCGSSVPKAMARVAMLDLRRGDKKEAVRHAEWAMKQEVLHPIAPAVLMLAQPKKAAAIAEYVRAEDPLNYLVNYLAKPEGFFDTIQSEPAQVALDMAIDLSDMGQYALAAGLLEDLLAARPEEKKAMVLIALAYYKAKLGCDPASLLAEAETAPVGNRYPNRLAEEAMLRFAAGKGCRYAGFLLGCLLYDKRHYAEGADLFAAYAKAVPGDYMGHRCLAVAYFSHLNKPTEALELMKKAIALSDSPQLLFETLSLMDKLSAPAAEKIALLESRSFTFDNLTLELAKAYNQAGQPEKAIDTLMAHTFVACEGGEHAIADQYMFAHFLAGAQHMKTGDYAGAKAFFESAFTLPMNLNCGLWHKCKYVPYRMGLALCAEALGDKETAEAQFRAILEVPVEFFSEGNLPELAWYHAVSARKLGMESKCQNILNTVKRSWNAGFDVVDNGYFAPTPFFVSFIDDPARMRRAHCLYLTGLVDLLDGKEDAAKAKLAESYALNTENLFCGLYGGLIG
ncbi:MAG: DUF5107 domain-containing protein, partial [Clostridia bacterium]|nr:DUF5107 domain-containing protein [Clostridia bacterium]